MNFIVFAVLGLIAGAIAKAIMPNDPPGGWLSTLLVGVVGAWVGGWLGNIIFGVDLGSFFELRTWALAIGGSLIVLAIWGFVAGRKK
ncbi:MAG: GlsB/YeaQ/YmgE family stress response membrane protein [Actinomycetaceae bacterium]|nr:GlsB/YeaQ/YmgE family stress response membrane protein [Actinomycetaceae bacterium]